MLIAPFFRSNSDINVDFYKSEDGINFSKIATPFKGRDGSLIYYNKQFLVLTTDYVPNNYDMAIMSSDDFKTWKWNAGRAGLCTTSNNKVWASEWFLDDNGKLYIITSVKQPKDEKDIDGRVIPNFRPYIIPVESTNPIKLGTPRMLNLENTNKIDGQIVKHNGIYYMFIKNEYNKNTEIWTSSDLYTWKKIRNYIVHDGERIEGVCCIRYDGRFTLYGDKFQDGTGIHYSFTNDFTSFSNWKPINTSGNKTRHGSVYEINSNNILNLMGLEGDKMIKIIGLRYGHSVNCRGARGEIDEVDSCKVLYNKVKAYLESLGYIVVDCTSNANNVNAELNEGTNKANNAKVDIYITIHMNAYDGKAKGVECWCYNANSKKAVSIANKICANISKLGTFNRGVKYNTKYHDLSASSMESIIVETLFCDNGEDAELFNKKTDELARAIANGIDSRVSLTATKPVEQKPQVEMHRNIIIYATGAEPDRICAEFFAMILNNHDEDCYVLDYNTYKLGKIDGRSIFAVGGSLEGKFKYHKIFKGGNRKETAQSMLEHLKKY